MPQLPIRDIRRVPLKYGGYSVSYRHGGRTRDGKPDDKWHAHVEIERRQYLELQATLLDVAVKQSAANVALSVYSLPQEPYAPIRRQLLLLLRNINRVRREIGGSEIPVDVLPLRRRVVKPFATG